MSNLDLDKKFVALCANNVDLLCSSFKDVDVEHLRGGHYKKIYKLLRGYYMKHKKLPTFDLLEEKLQNEKTKIFGDNPNADNIILGLRSEAVATDRNDYEFLTEEIKNRASHSILQSAIPQAVELIKEKQSIDGAADVLQQAVTSVKKNQEDESSKRTDNHSYASVIKETYQETLTNPEVAWGVKTGFRALDEATHGVGNGEMFVVSARHGNGKSMWLLSAAINMFKEGHNVALVSLEMPTEQYWTRFIACYAGLPTEAIKSATLNEGQQQQLYNALEDLEKRDNTFTIIDVPHSTVPTIAAELSTIAAEHSPDVLVVDYLGILRPTDTKLKDHEAQAAIVEEVRKLGRTLELPILTAVQLNREPTKGKKTKGTERLSRSDVIGATADVVLQIEEVDAEEAIARMSDRTKIFVIKNRKGKAPFEFEVRKNFACAQFEDWNPTDWLTNE